MDLAEVRDEMERARLEVHQLAAAATAEDLRRRSSGTRWTNKQLLYHMVFGYMIVRSLMPLVHLLGRLGWSRRFAGTLNAGRQPFHLINYLGSVAGGQLLPLAGIEALMDRTIRALGRRLDSETTDSLALTMHFPTDWDPYFRSTMSVADVYHYGSEHFEHHRRQLTL